MIELSKRLASAVAEGRIVSGIGRRCFPAIEYLAPLIKPAQEAWLRSRLRLPVSRRNGQLPSYSLVGDFAASREASLVGDALQAAMSGVNPLPAHVRGIDGMSGQKYRAFINLLVRSHPEPSYLEIGSWVGSTAAAAICNNKLRAVCIDNWSQFGGPRDKFVSNIEQVLTSDVNFNFIEEDFRKLKFDKIGRFNIYLFDGPHKEQDQYDGIVLARDALASRLILVVDDWNWRAVRVGTFRGLMRAGFAVEAAAEIRSSFDESHPIVNGKHSDWHNGYFLAVLRKRKLP